MVKNLWIASGILMIGVLQVPSLAPAAIVIALLATAGSFMVLDEIGR